LSISQGRAVGVAHYLLGGIVTTWSFFIARLISVGSYVYFLKIKENFLNFLFFYFTYFYGNKISGV